MITVAAAEKFILKQARSFGDETVRLEQATGRILAEDMHADRDLPPYDRVTMDGFAIRYADLAAGQRTFHVQATQAAGAAPGKLAPGSVIQIMTGAALPHGADTIVPVEETRASDRTVKILTDTAAQRQYIHRKGSDTKRGHVLVPAGHILSAASLSIAASAGKATVTVRRLPKAVVITTGDELVDIKTKPSAYQIRRSNNYAVRAALAQYGVDIDMLHMPDESLAMRQLLGRCLEHYDLIIISGGVSKGRFDYVPSVLADVSVEILFHGVSQKPGKPLLFGIHPDGPVIFACPGNPVSTMLCIYKHVLPWLRASLGVAPLPVLYAVLDQDVPPPGGLQLYVPVKLRPAKTGVLHAQPIAHNGSGDFLSLLGADAFLELPAAKKRCKKGKAYKTIALKPIL